MTYTLVGTTLDSMCEAFHCRIYKIIVIIGECHVIGDKIRDGGDIKARDGHFTDDTAPKDFNTRQIIVSPSIRYAGHHAFATPTKYVYFHSRILQPSYLKGRLPGPRSGQNWTSSNL